MKFLSCNIVRFYFEYTIKYSYFGQYAGTKLLFNCIITGQLLLYTLLLDGIFLSIVSSYVGNSELWRKCHENVAPLTLGQSNFACNADEEFDISFPSNSEVKIVQKARDNKQWTCRNKPNF